MGRDNGGGKKGKGGESNEREGVGVKVMGEGKKKGRVQQDGRGGWPSLHTDNPDHVKKGQ